MNKSLQVQIIKKVLSKKGIDTDLVDIESMIDSTLTLTENSEMISDRLRLLVRNHSIDMGTNSNAKIERFLEAVKIFDKQSTKKRLMDSRREAKKTFEAEELNDKNYGKWKNNINRYDIRGVDSKY